VPDYELYFFSKGTNSPDEAILFAVGEEEDETPHDWQMFFYGAVNQNGNGVGSSPFLHAILKLSKRSPAHITIAVKLRFFCTKNLAEYSACITGASRPRLENQRDSCIWKFVTYHLSDNW
jgi:hypothetical protein